MGEGSELFDDLPEQRAPVSIRQSGLTPIWTEHKAKLIARYLRYFIFITRHGAYIDGFAGPKAPEVPESWAAELVVTSEPRRLRQIFLCDVEAEKIRALNELVEAQPDRSSRHYEVLQGDFNVLVDHILGSGLITDKTASFCLIDQFSIECHWTTLEQLARHKSPGSRKIELFYFLATGWLGRTLKALTRNVDDADLWWGGPAWRDIKGMTGSLIAVSMAERLRDELGYRYVAAYPIYQRERGKGRVMFHMIHCSDHPEATPLMRRAHRSVTLAPEPEEQLEMELGRIEP